jgi:hypothetical protein
MILGMSPLLLVHVVVSLLGIVTGFVVLYGLIRGKPNDGWTAAFLVTTILTSVTGFPLPATQILPSHIFGIISMLLLAFAVAAQYLYHLAGAWRWIYVVTTISALYLNVVVGLVQSFQKLAFLKLLAPTQSEAPFLVAQAILLILFVVVGIAALKRFRVLQAAA